MSAKHTTLTAFAILTLLLVFLVASKWVAAPVPDEDAARSAERRKTLVTTQDDSRKKLESYAWANKEKGQVQIPIARAMELTLSEINAKQPVPVAPTPTPTPTPAPEKK
jgi:hypothetical protein